VGPVGFLLRVDGIIRPSIWCVMAANPEKKTADFHVFDAKNAQYWTPT
jgi:hypothetical protein